MGTILRQGNTISDDIAMGWAWVDSNGVEHRITAMRGGKYQVVHVSRLAGAGPKSWISHGPTGVYCAGTEASFAQVVGELVSE